MSRELDPCSCGHPLYNHRHIAAVCIKPEMVLEAITGAYVTRGWRTHVLGLPEDARFCGLGHDIVSNSIRVLFEHDTFQPCFAGGIPENLPLVLVHPEDDLGESMQ